MCSGTDVASLLSGFVILAVKHLPIYIKTRHCDFKGILMHHLRLEMDLFRVLEGFEVSRSMIPLNGKA